MEEKKITEAQVAEQTTSQENINKVESELDVIINENTTLKSASRDEGHRSSTRAVPPKGKMESASPPCGTQQSSLT